MPFEIAGKRIWEWVKHLFTESTFTDWVVASFTVLLGIVAYQQFVITGHQLEVMQTDERAWVEAHIANPPANPPSSEHLAGQVTSGAPIFFPITIKNVGKTPARRVLMYTWVVAEPAGSPVPLQCVASPTACPAISNRLGISLPNDPQPAEAYRTDRVLRPVPATPQEETDYESDKLYSALFGVISYQDALGSGTGRTFVSGSRSSRHREMPSASILEPAPTSTTPTSCR